MTKRERRTGRTAVTGEATFGPAWAENLYLVTDKPPRDHVDDHWQATEDDDMDREVRIGLLIPGHSVTSFRSLSVQRVEDLPIAIELHWDDPSGNHAHSRTIELAAVDLAWQAGGSPGRDDQGPSPAHHQGRLNGRRTFAGLVTAEAISHCAVVPIGLDRNDRGKRSASGRSSQRTAPSSS